MSRIRTISDFILFLRGKKKIVLALEEKRKVVRARRVFEKIMAEQRVYGVNTGVGALLSNDIAPHNIDEFQANLLASHACGVGKPVSAEIARGALLLLINTLRQGFAGVRLETLKYLIDGFNNGIVPVIPETGSLGASGDLIPLSHLILSLKEQKEIGFFAPGEVIFLINGTHFLTSVFALAVYESKKLANLADLAAAMTATALGASVEAFSDSVNSLTSHFGQMHSARNLRLFLKKNKEREGSRFIQDGYSIRCIPQVHGAVFTVISFAETIVNTEINSISLNPIIFADSGNICCGGNFHAQPVSIAADTLAIALVTLGNISERRIERLLNPNLSGLPAFLSSMPGVDSGLMIAQYTAAALVSRNKVLAYPASIGSVPVSASQEDFVSMAATAAMKAGEILENTRYILAIEFLCVVRAFEFRGRLLRGLEQKKMRIIQNCLSGDISRDIENIYQLIKNGTI